MAGFGKTARDGLAVRAVGDTVDAVIVNVLLLDPLLGVRKTNIGIREGRVAAIGRAGNPDTMDGVDIVLGTGTAIFSGEGLIATPGAIDTHVHMLSPRIAEAALASGITTIVGPGLRARLEPRHQPGLVPRAHVGGDRRVAAQLRLPGPRLVVAARAAARPRWRRARPASRSTRTSARTARRSTRR